MLNETIQLLIFTREFCSSGVTGEFRLGLFVARSTRRRRTIDEIADTNAMCTGPLGHALLVLANATRYDAPSLPPPSLFLFFSLPVRVTLSFLSSLRSPRALTPCHSWALFE